MAEVTPKRLNSADYYYLTKPIAGMQLDFNAIGQGWSVDLVTKFLIEKGVKVFFMELGGEIVAGYPKPDGSLWRFGIDQPTDGNLDRALQAIIELRNKGLATSGNYRKFYEKDGQRFAHTIDPRTGYPVQHNLLSATVVSQNAGKADALATAFMVMGMDSTIQMLEEKSYIGSHVYLIADDGSGGFQTYLSKQLEGMLKEQ
jgi:thiamine biosynthesis lipoprotein